MIKEWLGKSKMQCLVIGPGLGDDPLVVATAKLAVKEARKMGLHLVIDGSGLNVIAKVGKGLQGGIVCGEGEGSVGIVGFWVGWMHPPPDADGSG